MKKESKTYRIYDKTNKQWYEIPEDQYREYDRWRTALRKRMQYRGECFCPRSKWWLCGSNCLDGEFRNNTIIALDDPLPDGEGTQMRITELQEFIGSQWPSITEFDDFFVRKLIQQITVYDDQFTVELKSGITIEIKASFYIRRNGP